MYYRGILTLMFPVLYSPDETVYFLGFFTSWIRIRADPDPKHWTFMAEKSGSGQKLSAPGPQQCLRIRK